MLFRIVSHRPTIDAAGTASETNTIHSGYCGSTADYCAAPGCQDEFGDCTAGSGDGDGTGDGETGSGRCGVNFNNAKCSATECCSAEG